MLISVRIDDREVFTVKAQVVHTSTDPEEDVPAIVEAFFTDVSDPNDLLDNAAYIVVSAIDRAILEYFSEIETKEESGRDSNT